MAITFKGVEYKGYWDLGRAYGIHPSTLRTRIERGGMSLEDAINKKLQRHRKTASPNQLTISKSLQVATVHFSEQTMLDIENGYNNELNENWVSSFSIYPKSEYGYFIVATTEDLADDTPEEFRFIMEKAVDNDCYYLEIDRDFDENLTGLFKKFNW